MQRLMQKVTLLQIWRTTLFPAVVTAGLDGADASDT
jgi:hypothetical protein